MNSLIKEIIVELEAGRPFALATLLSHHGSTPRTAGAAMIVRPDGSIAGTIGGGQLEGKSIRLALDVIQNKRPARKEFYMTGKDAASTDMICGGNQEVLIEYIDPANEIWLRQYKAIADAIHNRRRAWQVIRVPRVDDTRAEACHSLILAEGQVDIPAGLAITPDEVESKPGKPVIHLLDKTIRLDEIHGASLFEVGGDEYLIDPVDIFGTVYLFGGGHVSLQVAIAAKMVGFRVVVLDDRPEFVSEERFPMAEERILVPSFATCFDDLKLDPNSYLVIVTRGHLHDQIVLEQALKTDAVYVGMIGSKRKCQTIFNALLEEGFSQQQIDSVFAPIGIDIEAESPEEIAISIVAELIQVRSKLMK